MGHPSLLVDAFGNLRENGEVLGFDILSVTRPSKEKAVMAHVTFGILAEMANSLSAPRKNLHRERCVPTPRKPGHRLPFLVAETIGPDQWLANCFCKRLYRLLRRWPDRNRHIYQR